MSYISLLFWNENTVILKSSSSPETRTLPTPYIHTQNHRGVGTHEGWDDPRELGKSLFSFFKHSKTYQYLYCSDSTYIFKLSDGQNFSSGTYYLSHFYKSKNNFFFLKSPTPSAGMIIISFLITNTINFWKRNYWIYGDTTPEQREYQQSQCIE